MPLQDEIPRLILFGVYAFTSNWSLQYVIQPFICIVALIVFLILRPYKRNWYNILDACMFANLIAISTLSLYNFHLTTMALELSTWAFSIQYCLIFLPLVYMCTYVVMMLCIKFRSYLKKKGVIEDTRNGLW